MVGGNGDGVWGIARFDRDTRCWLGTTTTYGNVNFFPIMVVVTMTSTDDAFSSTVKTMSEGMVVTIFIVVTHLVLLEARRIDGFFCYTDFLPLCRSERTRRVNGGFADTDFFTVGWLEARRVYGGFVDTDFFAVGWLEARRVNSRFVDTYVLTIAWLELGSVLTLSYIELCIVATAAWDVNFDFGLTMVTMRKVDVNLGVVVSAVVWKVYVNVCFGVSWSSFLADVEIFSAARTETILFTSDTDFFLAITLVPRRKIGGERGVLSFPSDALLAWKVDLTLDVGFGG